MVTTTAPPADEDAFNAFRTALQYQKELSGILQGADDPRDQDKAAQKQRAAQAKLFSIAKNYGLPLPDQANADADLQEAAIAYAQKRMASDIDEVLPANITTFITRATDNGLEGIVKRGQLASVLGDKTPQSVRAYAESAGFNELYTAYKSRTVNQDQAEAIQGLIQQAQQADAQKAQAEGQRANDLGKQVEADNQTKRNIKNTGLQNLAGQIYELAAMQQYRSKTPDQYMDAKKQELEAAAGKYKIEDVRKDARDALVTLVTDKDVQKYQAGKALYIEAAEIK